MNRLTYKYLTGMTLALGAISMVGGVCYGESKLDTRSVVFSKLMNADRVARANSETPDSAAIIRNKIRMMQRNGENKYTDVLITLSEEISEAELERLGVHNPEIIGSVAVGAIDLNDLDRLEAADAISGISISGAPRLHCDMARADAGVETVRLGNDGLPKGFDGSGVIVSIFDQGIEFSHLNFLTPDKKETRVKRIWHYKAMEDETGKPYTVETTYLTPEEIKEFPTDDETLTHGTHTLGIMAGSFGVNKEDPQYDYSGFAPGSDILVGCGSLSYANVIRAINNFKEYADSENKPLVVNLSFGDNIGPHDGTDAFPKALNQLAETVPVFMSAGNEAKTNIALHKTFSENDTTVRTVISPLPRIKTYLGVSWEAACEVQIWSEDERPFTVQTGLWDRSEDKWVFMLPTAEDGMAAYIANGAYEGISDYQNDDFDFLYQDSAIGISTGLDPNNHRYTADIWYMLNKLTNHIDRNIVPVLIVTGEEGQRIDIYSDGDYNEFDTARMEGWDKGSSDGTISNIACGNNTISVGSYCTRDVIGDATPGEVSAFSSWGVMPDGRSLPTILAPGESLVSSMSTPFTASDYYYETAYPAVYGVMFGEDNPFYWTVMSGTSQASPAMAGIAALWLQANPQLTPAEIKQIAIETARPTSEMTPQCGAGKVDALAGIKKALASNGIEGIADSTVSDIYFTNEGNTLTVESLTGQKIDVAVYDTAGRQVLRTQSQAGGSVAIDKSMLGLKGIYVIRINSSNATSTTKIAL